MSVEPDSESTGNAALDERLSKPILRGDVGIDTAQVWMSAFLIAVIGLIAWSSSLRVPFQALDRQVVRDNAALHSIATLPDAAVDGAPQPLALLTLALNWAIAPGSAAPMRFTGLILHLVNGLLVFLLARRLLPNAAPVVAMLAGMLFVLHPLASESILYVSARGQLLAATLGLASVLLFMRAVGGEPGVRTGSLAASLLLFVFAVFADASAAVVPALILAVHRTMSPRARGGWRVHAPFWAALPAIGVYAAVEYGLTRPQNFPALFAQYARMAVAPFGLSIVHDAPAIPWPAGAAALVAAVLATGLLLWRRNAGGAALLWVFLSLAFASWPGPALIERRAYFALAGLALLAPWLYLLVKPRFRAVAGLAAAALVLVAAFASYRRIDDWRTENGLWYDASIKAPASPEAFANLGRAMLATQPELLAQPETAGMITQTLERAIELGGPEYAQPRLSMAAALLAMGKTDEALHACYDVLRTDLNNRQAALAAANLLFDAGSRGASRANWAEAADLYRKADALAPLDAPALARLGAALSQLGHLEQAEAALKRAAELAPDDAILAQSLQNIESARKRTGTVEQQALALMKKDPRDAAAFKLAAQANAMRDDTLGASYALDAVWRANAADFPTWLMTGFVWARLGAADRFVAVHATPPAKPENAAPAWAELARRCAGSGLWEAAEAYLHSAPAQAETNALPLVRMAEVARQVKQPQRALDYLQKAREQHPDSPAPWLATAELAAEANDPPAAADALDQAKQRGAPDAEIEAIRKKFNLDSSGQVRTVIQ